MYIFILACLLLLISVSPLIGFFFFLFFLYIRNINPLICYTGCTFSLSTFHFSFNFVQGKYFAT